MKDYFKKIFKYKTTWTLLIISVFSIALTLGRRKFTGLSFFTFMIWNLFLAFIPWLAASIVYVKNIKNKVAIVIIILLWLVFFPNAPYMLTDLVHLGKDTAAPIWFDIIMLLSYGFAGLIYGFTSLQMIEEKIKSVFNLKHASQISIFLIFLSCFGIYLGRFLRWNTWDLVTNMKGVMGDIFRRVFYPQEYPQTWIFTVLFGILLNIVYMVSKQDELKLDKKI